MKQTRTLTPVALIALLVSLALTSKLPGHDAQRSRARPTDFGAHRNHDAFLAQHGNRGLSFKLYDSRPYGYRYYYPSPYGYHRYYQDPYHYYSPQWRLHDGPHSGLHYGPYYDPYRGYRDGWHAGPHWDLHGPRGHYRY